MKATLLKIAAVAGLMAGVATGAMAQQKNVTIGVSIPAATHGWTGGAVLLVCFYLAAGILLARAQRVAPRGRDLLEFGLVSLVAFAILALTA